MRGVSPIQESGETRHNGDDDPQRVGALLRRRFWTFLAALAALSIAAYAAFSLMIFGQDRLAGLLNDLGRQRMLCMRLSATALQGADMAEEPWRQALVRDITAMEQTFADLPERARGVRMGQVVAPYLAETAASPEAPLILQFRQFAGEVHALAATPMPPDPAAVARVVNLANTTLLPTLETLMRELEEQGRSRGQEVQGLALAGELSYLLLLLFLGVRILWPLSRDVEEKVGHIAELETLQRSIVTALTNGLILIDRKTGEGEGLNPAAVEIFGPPLGGRLDLRRAMPALVAEPEETLVAWTRHTIDGSHDTGTPLHLEVTVRRIAGGRLLAIVRDVTEARENEARLRSINEALDQAPMSVVITDAEGLIEYVNPKFTENTGYCREEVIGKTPRVLKSGRTSLQVYKNLWSTLKNGEQWRGEIMNRRKSGELFWEFQAISPLRDSRGHITNFLVVKEDVTEQKEWQSSLIRAMEETRRASQAKSDFLASMSHELRTPLNAIIGFSELMLLQPWGSVGDPRYSQYLGDIQNSGRHLLQLINDLLDLSKVEAARMELEDQEVPLDGLITQSLHLVKDQAHKRGVKLRYTLSPEVVTVVADPLRLKQVLLNLLTNAIKFTDAGKSVEISAALRPSGAMALQVRDEGCGIREDDLERVLEPFGQARDPRVREEIGTGLGLPLSRKLTELHGGELLLDSIYGQGTTATVLLPASRVITADTGTGTLEKKAGPEGGTLLDPKRGHDGRLFGTSVDQ